MNKLFASMGLAAALVLGACQTVSTNNQPTVNTPFPDARPTLVVARDFESATAVLKGDAREGDYAERAVRGIGADLERELRAAGFESRRLFAGQEPDGFGWVVTGRLRLVQWNNEEVFAQGDRIECVAYVYDVGKSRTQPFLTFEASAPRLAGDAASSLQAACETLARVVAQRVREYAEQNF